MRIRVPAQIESLEARIAPAAVVFELSNLNGSNGFALNGVGTNESFGRSVSDAGDVNGDGFDDVIIGAPDFIPYGARSGAAYVVFGKADGFVAKLELSALDGINGFKLDGVAPGDFAGFSVSGAGDVNGDGFDDVIIGAFLNDSNGASSGTSYVVFGKASAYTPSVDLSVLDGINGFKLRGIIAGDESGFSVSGAGDVNRDGFDDLLIGAPEADANGLDSGATYVVFGKAGAFAPDVDLSALDGNNGFRLSGVMPGDRSGSSVSGAGDLNGDGLDDLLIGARSADANGPASGATYVVFGRTTPFGANIELSALDGTDGFRLSGAAALDNSGASVSGAGDVNGDGFGDVVIGTNRPDTQGNYVGSSYVVFGKGGGFAPNVELSALDGINGFKLDGVAPGDFAGFSVSGAGDVNGDGFDDVIIGAYRADPSGSDSGASYLIFGKASAFPPNLELPTLDGADGFKLSGVGPGDFSGTAVSAAGDLNADGFGDLIIGAFGANVNGGDSGASYVVFGIPTIHIADTAVAEGRAGSTMTSFTLSLSAAPKQTVTLQYETANGTATAPEDYAALPLTTLTFNPGESSKTITVAVSGDALFEADQIFFLNLRNPTNVIIGDPQVQGTILNDDLDISPNGKNVTVTDSDGDTVTIKTSNRALSTADLVFAPDGTLQLIDLSGAGIQFNGTDLIIEVERAATGDGLVNIGAINAKGLSLGKVTVPGDLGQIDVGSGSDNALKSLTVGSLGAEGATTQVAGTLNPLLSEITGGLDKLIVTRDVQNAVVEVTGKLGKVTIGGNLIDNRSSTPLTARPGSIDVFNNGGIPSVSSSEAGSIFAPTIDSVTVMGDIDGGEISAETQIKKVKVVGRLTSEDPLDPAILRVGSEVSKVVVTGDVKNALILAGYNRKLEPLNPDASIGKVIVKGDWIGSSVVAGIADPTDNGFGINDTIIPGDGTPDVLSRIASVVIKGTATGSATLTNHSAITSQKIGALQVAGEKLPLTKASDDFSLDLTNHNFRAVEL